MGNAKVLSVGTSHNEFVKINVKLLIKSSFIWSTVNIHIPEIYVYL